MALSRGISLPAPGSVPTIINFSNVSIVGQPLDQSLETSAMQRIVLRIYNEVGNGQDGNGGSTGDIGTVDTSKLVSADGYVLPVLASLVKTETLNGNALAAGEVLLKMEVVKNTIIRVGQLPTTPDYIDLVLTPVPVLEGKGLDPLSTYLFSYSTSLPGKWNSPVLTIPGRSLLEI